MNTSSRLCLTALSGIALATALGCDGESFPVGLEGVTAELVILEDWSPDDPEVLVTGGPEVTVVAWISTSTCCGPITARLGPSDSGMDLQVVAEGGPLQALSSRRYSVSIRGAQPGEYPLTVHHLTKGLPPKLIYSDLVSVQ